jgi:hypothetical protein
MTTSRHRLACDSYRPPSIVIAVNSNRFDMFTAAGSPTTPTVATFIINSGIYVYGGFTGDANGGSLYMSATFPAGSQISINNNGSIVAAGGAGGAPGVGTGVGHAGTAGGPAISLLNDVTIDNTYGNIFGGGDGGYGGDGAHLNAFTYGGNAAEDEFGGQGGGGIGIPAVDGATSSAPGPGSAGSCDSYQGLVCGAHGNPGNWWGNSGPAIILNGHTVTWLGGNNGSQVQGTVS